MFRIKQLIRFFKTKEPAIAYDLLAADYDSQTNNLVMLLDDKLLRILLENVEIKNKTILDFGCGTGRHWEMLYKMNAKEIIGVDVSENMLKILIGKFPDATTHLFKNRKLKGIRNNFCDVIISTLTIGYLKNLAEIFKEWDRVLNRNSRIIFTDLHPTSLNKGVERVFSFNSKLIHVRNYIYSLQKVRFIARQLNWKELEFVEICVDEDLKVYYERENALDAYQKFYGVPLIYGIVFTKL